MENVFDDLTTRFKSFSDTLDKSLTSIDVLPFLSSRPKGSVFERNEKKLRGGQSNPLPTTKSRKEREERAELVLQQMPAAYFDQAFDPLEHELRQMSDDTKQDEIDVVVDRLSAAVEVVGVKLAKHVLRNQEKLIAGIGNVTQVEDDLKAAHVICKGTRAQLGMAAEEVQRQIKIITCTRKKQAYMEVLEVVSKIKKVKDLQQTLRRIHEDGDFAEAVLQCIDCFQAVESLGAFTVAPELCITVQRHYFDTLQRLDAALLNVCGSFTPQSYSRLLEAYLLQGLSGPALSGKVLACFKDSINDTAMRLIRSMVLAKAAFSGDGSGNVASNASAAGRSSFVLGDCTTDDLCKVLPGDMVEPCLKKLLEVLYELLGSYHRMTQWHKAGLEQQQKAAAGVIQQQATDNSPEAGSNNSECAAAADSEMPSQAQLDQVQAATCSLLEAVSAGLTESKAAILEIAAARVKELIAVTNKCKGDDFIKVVDGCLQFVAIAEAFAGSSLSMRTSLLSALSSNVGNYQKSNMEALRMALALEDWQPVSANDARSSSSGSMASLGIGVNSMKQQLTSSPYMLPEYGQSGSVTDFGAWIQAGNPFKQKERSKTVGGQSVLPSSCGKSAEPQVEPDAQAAPPAAAQHRVATKSSLLVLKWMNNLAALMPVLPARQAILWAAVTELFDNVLLACFILFSGVTLETLVWQEDLLPHRLRSALIRITTSPGCKYKAQVEELQRTKPTVPLLASPAASFLDFSLGISSSVHTSSSPASKFDAFTKKFKDTVVELINTDLAQPLPASSHSQSLGGYYAGHQQVQPPQIPQQPRSSSPALAQQQSQQPQQSSPPLQRQPQRLSSSTPPPGGPESAEGSLLQSNSSLNSTNMSSGTLMTHEGMQYHVPGAARPLGLKERVMAIESLTSIADVLKAAKSSLLVQLGSAGMLKEIDGYFTRTVDAAQDLRDTIYTGGAKQLLTAVVDPERGTAAQIMACNYRHTEPATQYQPWVEPLVKQYKAFNEFISASGLPEDVQQKMWQAAVRLGCDAMLDGLGRISRCTQEGRAAMSLDLSAVEKGLRGVAHSSALPALRLVDNYVKAFYIPWDDLAKWAQIHLVEYGRPKILVLVEAMSEAYGIKRAQKAALIEKLNTELAEFA